ncbi:MAG: hypothetical protein ABIN89_27350 [Chitinophagaceae bacterium]
MKLMFSDFTNPAIWIKLLMLTFLEIILGADNILLSLFSRVNQQVQRML